MFIQVIQGRCNDADRLHSQMDMWREQLEPGAEGFLGGTYGLTDDNEFIGVVRFDSHESAERNSQRPEQGRWWADTEQCFDGEVTFHDCDDVTLMFEGGSDDAQFVQVIQGRLRDPAKFHDFMSQPMDMLHKARPDIIGGTVAIDENGFFTQTVAFRTEAEAREREQQEVPEEMRGQMDEMTMMMEDVSYHDLHHPWFATAGMR
ncbi:hypothetical protein N865_13620 [Intrasporangium oryzae NRRL B-24470]|uniref:ABM domain-containing protein n=1 Tax=Intrasporangium oryzae NRRL B-24470 TaxID=1386089 RepID=W9G638_9MICO|nr:hypothetical protein [Intrasporangium oryzae]EWT00777.1 hypothetical protein N865_13620 [Intrasporangium oryzae NRRL B-24470]